MKRAERTCDRSPALATTPTWQEVRVMASRYPIVPMETFPADRDRDRFGEWVTGFSDGEGYFFLQNSTPGVRPGRLVGQPFHQAGFCIVLRADDVDILKLVNSYFGCGILRIEHWKGINPTARWMVRRSADLLRFIIPHFEAHPLQAKKAKDFSIWKIGVLLAAKVSQRSVRRRAHSRGGCHPKWTSSEQAQFSALAAALKAQRVYKAPLIEIPELEPVPPVRYLFD